MSVRSIVLFTLAAVAPVSLLMAPQLADGCSRVLWNNNGTCVVTAR